MLTKAHKRLNRLLLLIYHNFVSHCFFAVLPQCNFVSQGVSFSLFFFFFLPQCWSTLFEAAQTKDRVTSLVTDNNNNTDLRKYGKDCCFLFRRQLHAAMAGTKTKDRRYRAHCHDFKRSLFHNSCTGK